MYGIIVLIIYFGVMILATVLLTKREKTTEGFFVGNRKMGTISSGMSIAATWIWAPALLVSSEKAYTNGIVGLFWFLVPNVLCLLLFIPFAKMIRKQMPQGITLSGYMQETYKSKKVKGIYLFQLTGLTILSTAVQLLAGSKLLSLITGLPFWLITIILAVIAFSYSQFSGIKASVTTDVLQMGFMLVASIMLVVWTTKINGGMPTIFKGLGSITGEYVHLFNKKGLEVFFAFGLPTAIGLTSGPFGDQCFWQRAFSVKEKGIGKAFSLGAALFAIVPLSMGILGFIAAGSGFKATNTGMVNFELITHQLPTWAWGAFLFMILSGLLSTIDSNLCAISSLTTDMRKSTDVKTSKKYMIALLLIAILIANIPGLTVTYLFLIYGQLRASTLLPTILSLKKVKLTANGVFFGVLSSLVIGWPIFAYGTLANLSTFKTIGSLTTVLLSAIVSIIISRIEEQKLCR